MASISPKPDQPWNQELLEQSWTFAETAHEGQTMPGSEVPYTLHLAKVLDFVLGVVAYVQQPDLLVQCAILHDVVEDTDTTLAEIKESFGQAVADGVSALTKNSKFTTKSEQMIDSLSRIKPQPKEIWMVKLADRISSMDGILLYWGDDRIWRQFQESLLILRELGSANEELAERLRDQIRNYPQTIQDTPGRDRSAIVDRINSYLIDNPI